MLRRFVFAPVNGAELKFAAPGVPPICGLAVQFSAALLARFGFFLTNETPDPSGPFAQSPSVLYVTESMSRPLRSRSSSFSPELDNRPENGPSTFVTPATAVSVAGELATTR